MRTRVIKTPYELQRFLNCNDETLKYLCFFIRDLSSEPTPWATYEPLDDGNDSEIAHFITPLFVLNKYMQEYDAGCYPGDEDVATCPDPRTLILSREAFDSKDPMFNPAPSADALMPLTEEFVKLCGEYYETGAYSDAEDPATIPEFEYDGKITLDAIYDADDTLDDELDQ